jgi:hypothetical protein
MADVMVAAWADGDGFLSVDTQEWINERGEYSEQLTDDLRDWMDEEDHRYPTAEVLTLWAKARSGATPVGLYGEGTCWEHNTCTVNNVLSDEIGFVVFSAGGELGDLMITISGDGGLFHSPTVYLSTVDDLAEWTSYDCAEGACANGHEWHVTFGWLLHSENPNGFDRPSVTGQTRVPDGDRDRAYIACPDCGHALRFVA